ncbi:MAG: hypothetical protein J3Q66DRAFT_101325 [Benniella sp.]|nr:MAG: hypothetical protein J3Q66DRAFT_101325 [Benniella sp.]
MLTLQACAVSTTGTNFPPAGDLNGPPVQVSSTSCSSSSTSYSLSSQPHCSQQRHSFRTLIETSESAWMSAGRSTVQQQPCFNQQQQQQQHQQQQQQQQQQQRQSRKRTCEGTVRHQSTTASDNTVVTQEREDSVDDAPSQCPRIQTQKLSLPRKQCESLDVSFQETYSVVPQCLVEPNALAKANFVDCLVDTSSGRRRRRKNAPSAISVLMACP